MSMNKSNVLLALLVGPVFLLASYTPTPKRSAPQSVDYYISTAGSDSNACSSSSKCRTLAYVLGLLPRSLDNNYTVNVADGTYAEPIDTSGFIGAGGYGGSSNSSISIIGNAATPANVIFSGTTVCTTQDSNYSFRSGACLSGHAYVKLSGLKISNAQRNGIACYGGNVELSKVQIVLTGGASLKSVGLNALGCNILLSGDLTISGFDTNAAPAGGLGFYISHTSNVEHRAGTLTITGPTTSVGVDAHGTVGLVVEYAPSGFAVTDASAAIAISGVQTGLLVNSNGDFSNFVGAAVSITNGSTTPTSSHGIETNGSATVNFGATPSLTIDHYSVCMVGNGNSEQSVGPSGHTLTNCTASSTSNGSQVIIF